MDLTTILLSLLALLAILLLCAVLLYCLCYLTGKNVEDDDDDGGNGVGNDNYVIQMKGQTTSPKLNGETRGATNKKTALLREGRNRLLVAGGKQMMCSRLQRSATDSDVILATAVSAIPLKELGGRNNDVIVDVDQQLLFNKEDQARQEAHQCIVCKTRREITWSQVSCYAQTTIGVLVYKRALISDSIPPRIPTRKPTSVKSTKSHRKQSQAMATNQQAAALEQVLKSFEINDEGLMFIKSSIGKEFELGLSDEDNATIKMLITYVRELSRGDETGAYLALDLGGTHFRVLLVQLGAGGGPKVTTAVHDIPHELLVTQNGQELFDYIALKLLEFVQQYKLKRRRISLGFTFSFPCKQYGLTQSVLVKWCKGFRVGGVVGTDVVRQLKGALKRQLAGLVEAYIDVVAVINDTTGTLVACANTNKDCRVGLIVGTGFNACYMEKLDRCEKWPANYTNPKQVIINCEWGAMGDNSQRRELDKFRNEFDFEVDSSSVNPKNQTYEKMVAGMYIGELLRLSMVKLYRQKVLFATMAVDGKSSGNSKRETPSSPAAPAQKSPTSPLLHQSNTGSGTGTGNGRPPRSAGSTGSGRARSQVAAAAAAQPPAQAGNKLLVRDSLNGRHLSMLAKDELNGTLEEATKVMQELNITGYTQSDLRMVVQLASKIMHRSAHLVAAGISALLERMQRPFTVIGYDGSVVRHHPYFLQRLTDKCAQLTRKEFKFEFMLSSDGSGIGAAVVAAALHKERRPLYVVKPGKLYEMHFTKSHPSSTLSLDTNLP